MGESFRKYIRGEVFTVKYARDRSDMRGKEFHPFHEIIYFMGGDGCFISDSGRVELSAGMVMVIPKASYHQLCITGGEEDYHRLVIHFDDVPALLPFLRRCGGVSVTRAGETGDYLFGKVLELYGSRADTAAREAVIFSAVTLWLSGVAGSAADIPPQAAHTAVTQCLTLIHEKLSDDLSVASLAAELNLSPSALSHIFKREMHISIYKYILEKRLVLARERILTGESATAAAAACGFGDYSGFYRQYVKMFGTSPAARQKKESTAGDNPPEKENS